MANFYLTPAAQQDLEDIWVYSFQEWGISQANQYTDLLGKAFVNLASNPYQATSCDEIRAGYRYWPVKSHLIFFKTIESGIEVIRILHGRMDSIKILQ